MKDGRPKQSNASVHDVADSAFAGPAMGMPFAATIQQAFGAHDVSGISAHQDESARSATSELGATAFASGSRIAFGKTPDLHTAAHEAAHVVQQRSGVDLAGGVGRPGDRHEQHADQVADAVVSGASAESLLGPTGGASGRSVIQASGGLVEQPAPGEGGRGHPGAVGEKPFTDEERMWIDDVLAEPLIQVVFSSYSDIPVGTLHRVKKVSAGSSANGQFSKENDDLAISDKVYDDKALHGSGTDSFRESDEEAFKGTLIHELFHFLEENATTTEPNVSLLPKHLVAALLYPEKFSFGPYAFGWFLHPDHNAFQHFDLAKSRFLYGDDPEMPDGRRASVVMEEETWESSPMPQSGTSISAEEDMCESFSMVMTSKRTQAAFAKKYPKRFHLLDQYIRRLQEAANKRAAP